MFAEAGLGGRADPSVSAATLAELYKATDVPTVWPGKRAGPHEECPATQHPCLVVRECVIDIGNRASRAYSRQYESVTPFPTGGHIRVMWHPRAGTWTAVARVVLANAFTLVGVVLLGWDAGVVLSLYWVECGIVAVVAVAKIRHAGSFRGFLKTAFFLGGYAWCWWIYGKFVAFFSAIELTSLGPVSLAMLLFSAGGLAVNHVVSYRQEFVENGEYRQATTNSLLVKLFLHLAPLNVAIIAGAVGIAFYGGAYWMIPTLVALKTLLDVLVHVWEHDWIPSSADERYTA